MPTTLEKFWLPTVTSVVVVLLVAIFFVSGADAASIICTLSERGAHEPSRPTGAISGAAGAC